MERLDSQCWRPLEDQAKKSSDQTSRPTDPTLSLEYYNKL